jgi:hypothetical protein
MLIIQGKNITKLRLPNYFVRFHFYNGRFLARLFYEKGSYPTRPGVGVGVGVGVTPWLSFSYHPTLFQKY